MIDLFANRFVQKHATSIYVAILIAVALAANVNTLSNGFVWDDIQQVLNNKWITDTAYLKEIFTHNVASIDPHSATSYYRPLMYVCYMAIYAVFGLASRGWHLANVLVHTGVVIVLFMLCRQLFLRDDAENRTSAGLIAFVAALMFAVHPIHTEAVAWVAALPELSYSLFYLLAFWLYLRAHPGKDLLDADYAASLVFYFIAMLFKEPAITLPLLIVACDYADRKSLRGLPFLKYLPYVAAAGLYLLIRHQALGGMAPSRRFADLSPFEIALNGPVLFTQYLAKLILPANLKAIYAYVPVKTLADPQVLIGLVVCAAFGLAMWVARHNRRVFPFLALMVVPIVPALYLPALGVMVFAERYLYLPSAGFVILLGLAIDRLFTKSWKTVATVLVLLVLAGYSAETVARNRVWKDSLTLWGDSVKKTPNSPHAHLYYGYALYQAGFLADAETEYRSAIALDGNLTDAYINLGIVYHKTNRIDEAIKAYRQALRIAPDSAIAYNCLGAAYEAKGHVNEALDAFTRGVQLNPNDPELHNSLGKLYANMGRFIDAAREFRAAADLNPTNREYVLNLDKVLKMKNEKRSLSP